MALPPNARGEPRPEAGAQRTLEGVGSSAWLGVEFESTAILFLRLHKFADKGVHFSRLLAVDPMTGVRQ